MNMEKAKIKAKEAGYIQQRTYFDENGNWDYVDELCLLDPLFWQALGKAENWNMVCEECGTYDNCMCGMTHPPKVMRWKHEWHRFIDWLIDGAEIDLFFEEILSK